MSYSRRHNKLLAEINVVPYVDVMLVLLVIFMITTPLLTQGVQVNLPKAQAQTLDSETQEPIIVTVDDHGLYYLNIATKPENPISPIILVNRVAAELRVAAEMGRQRKVLVRGDRDVPYGKVVSAMVLLQKAGSPAVGLLTEQPQSVKRG